MRLLLEGGSSELASDAGSGAGWYAERRGGSGRGFARGIGSGEDWYADNRGGLGRGLCEKGMGDVKDWRR